MGVRFGSLAAEFKILTQSLLDLLQKKYVLSLKACSSLGQTLNYGVDWDLIKLAGPATL